ncbi:MAG: Monofunctional biosynthetic peptidoglycan transglycosylase [Myxococcaceae bacterium]|nr:Monofunctional biosynthetic peptidoglycan transglycosylase [Myxococcaceae bacterium]
MKDEIIGSLREFVYSGRGRWVAAGLVSVVLVLIGAFSLLPGLAERKAAERLDRLGLEWTVGDSSLHLSGLSFADVVLKTKGGTAPLARLEAVELQLAWFRALTDPRAALQGVQIANLKVELDVEQLRQLRANRPKQASSGEPASPAGSELPRIAVQNVSFKLRDEEGTLVVAQLESLTLEDSAWKAELAHAYLGDRGGERVELTGIHAGGPLIGRQPQFAYGVVDTAILTLRADRAVDPTLPGKGGLIRRFKNVRSALRSGQAAVASDEKKAALYTKDAKVELKRARVLDGAVTPKRPILEKLNLAVLAEGEASLRVKGDGETATGGGLQWDLHITPRDLKIEGRVALREVPLALFTPVLPKLPFYELERTRVGANLAITGKGLESASVRGELSIVELGFESDRIAKAPVGPISFTARGQATWTPARRELSGLRGEVVVDDARVLITGDLAWPEDGYRIDLKAEMPKTKCETALRLFPDGLLDELSSVALKGDIAAKVETHIDSADLDSTKLDFDFQDKCKFVTLPEAMNVSRFERPFTHRVLEPDETVFEMETGPGTPAWTPMDQISPFMVQAVVAHEDGRFFTHHGFAETEIGAALARNLKARAFKFGASTITMQLVKNVFLHRDKLLSRKFQEALIVWWLEQQVDKKWLLELYLNVIEYGTSIYGIRNAALHYFGILPIALTPAQSAFLATILPSPKAYDEQYEKGTISESTKRKVVSFLQHMRARNRIDEEALAFGLEELENFHFYNPNQPPPSAPEVRGQAAAPPFQKEPVDGWNTYDSTLPKPEDGSFGFGF